eukprot:9785226-Lingulodinium_polyedra.AAC.1
MGSSPAGAWCYSSRPGSLCKLSWAVFPQARGQPRHHSGLAGVSSWNPAGRPREKPPRVDFAAG